MKDGEKYIKPEMTRIEAIDVITLCSLERSPSDSYIKNVYIKPEMDKIDAVDVIVL